MRQYAMKAVIGCALAYASLAGAADCGPGKLVVSQPNPILSSDVADGATSAPLPDALRHLAPAGWTFENPDHLSGPTVSVSTHRSLEEGLRDIAVQAQVCVTVDTASKTLRVNVGHAVRASASVAPIAALPPELSAQVSDEGLYELRSGETVRDAFSRWSRSAGYTLVWQAPIDMPVQAPVSFAMGTRYEDAVKQSLGAFWKSKHALIGRLYKNRVLVISGRNE